LHHAARDSERILFEVYPCKRAVTPPSPDLTFRVLRKSIIQERIQGYLEGYRVKDMNQTGEKQWEFPDPDTRKITILQDEEADDYIRLEKIGIHSLYIEDARGFYKHLFGQEAVKKNNKDLSTSYIFSLGRHKLELLPTEKSVIPASPSLIYQVSDLDDFAEKMNSTIKETKEWPHTREISFPDPEGRKIYLYETIPEKKESWLDKLYQRFIGNR